MSVWPEWKIKDFSEGMVDRVDDNLLPDNAASDCRNFICRYLGRLQKRNGQTRLNSAALTAAVHGLYAYYYGTSRKLVVTAGTIVSVWNPVTLAFDSLKTGVDASAVMLHETCANYMVGMNGVDAPFKWDGTTVTALANAPATGRYPTLYKNYLFCVPGTNLSQVWWADLFAPETWPAINYWDIKQGDGDAITCMKQFYSDLVIFKNRSIHVFKGSSLQDFRLDEMESRIGCVGPQAAVIDGTKIYFISAEGLYSFNGLTASPIHSERIPKLWESINKKNLSKAVAILWDEMVWFALPLQNTLQLKITAGCTVAGNITISLGGIDKTVVLSLTDDTVDEVAAKIRALIFDGWTLGGTTDTVTFTRNELHQPLTLVYGAETTGTTATITETEQTTNNLVIMYNPSGGQFWPTAGINASCFQQYHDGTELKLYSGDTVAGYVNQQDVGTEDFGSPISAYWIGKAFDQGQPEHEKKARKVFIEDAPNQDSPVTLHLSLDYGTFSEWTYKKGDGLIREYRRPSALNFKWRYITPKFIHNSAGGCEVRGLMIPIKTKPKPKGRAARA